MSKSMLERGLVPDPLLRFGIRRICQHRLRKLRQAGPDALARHVEALRQSPVAAQPEAANAQHYEVPSGFFAAVLGPRLKYSCCTWNDQARSLADAEIAALVQVQNRADLDDGQKILELGCGWGSLTLWMAERLPNAQITAISNSHGQREFIEQQARERGLHNIHLITADANTLRLEGPFDRVVSIEMFEHMRNWEALLSRIAGWLSDDGKLFVHVFAHERYAYLYEDQGPSDWMTRHFFTGGQMPSEELLLEFHNDLVVTERWRLGGEHYAKTSNAWLANLDLHRDEALAALGTVTDQDEVHRAYHRWRIFFMACAELFGYRDGREWGVSQYLLQKREAE